MASNKAKPFECTEVKETVHILLRKRPRATDGSDLMVKCDQSECQHVDKNVPPCPLTLDLFADEIQDREKQARQRQEDRDYERSHG